MSQRRSDKSARRSKRKQRSAPSHLQVVGSGGAWRPPPPTRSLPPHLDGPESLPEAVRQTAAEDSPLELLQLASTVLSSLDPRLDDPLHGPEGVPRSAFVEALLMAQAWETDLLCRVMAHLSLDDEVTELARASLPHGIPAPPWVGHLEELRVTRALISSEPLGGADNVVLELRLPGGGAASVITLVDHREGSAVKDAFVAPLSAADYRRHVAQSPEGEMLVTDRLDLEDVRELLDPAIGRALTARSWPETGTWPATLALLERVLADLPEPDAVGAEGLSMDELDAARDAVVDEFVASEHFIWADDGYEIDTANLVAWLHDEFFNGGLEEVTPETVEVVMERLWAQESLGLAERTRTALPEVLRGWTRFVHARTGAGRHDTEETLHAIDRSEAELTRQLQGGERMESVGELLAQYLSAGLEEGYPDPDDVDIDPLPDEARSLRELSPHVRALVDEVLDLAEPVAMDLGGVEARTALRRTAARLAESDPAIFTRGRSVPRTAAALTWVVAVANDLVGRWAGVTVGELLDAFGVKGSVADRGTRMLEELGWDDADDASSRLLHLDLTVSSKRAEYLGLDR